MKCQALFSKKNNTTNLLSVNFLISVLWVNAGFLLTYHRMKRDNACSNRGKTLHENKKIKNNGK